MSIEAVNPRGRSLRTRREVEALGLADRLLRLDWLLLAAHAGIVVYGLWAIDGITMHDAGGSAVARQAVYACAGGLLFLGALFVDPTGISGWRGRSTSARSP